MKRWWADPQESVSALNVVDDSDVVNGVGVALLGYHGLIQKVFKPLASETLVDIQTVRNALNDIDLEPVAKALGNATKTVMGDASERYGILLADDVHKRAVSATERLLSTWTNTGMPWPQAIEKAAEVHGVPIERLGRYAHAMKAPNITAQVRADYADRELMTYASEFGKREAIIDSALIEKQQRKEFKEEDHPRNPNGEFRTKDAEVISINEKQKKLDKINRINRINQINRRNLNNAARIISEKKKEVAQKLSDAENSSKKTLEQKFQEKKFSERKFNNKFAGKQFSPRQFGDGNPTAADFKDVKNIHKWDSTVYIVLHSKNFETIKHNLAGKFFIGQLDPDGVTAISENGIEEYIDNWGGNKGVQAGYEQLRDDNQFIFRTNWCPVDRDSMVGFSGRSRAMRNIDYDTESATIVPRAQFETKQGGQAYLNLGPKSDVIVPTYLINWVNSDYASFSKNALSGQNLNNFNDEHPRSEDGRFKDKNAIDQHKLDKIKRIERINRINQINNKNRANQMKMLVERQKAIQSKQEQIKQELFGERKFKERKFKERSGNRRFQAKQWNKNNIPFGKIDLADKFVLIEPINSTHKLTDTDYVARKLKDDRWFMQLGLMPFMPSDSLYEQLPVDVPVSMRKSGVETLIHDFDLFQSSRILSDYSDRQIFITDGRGVKLQFDDPEDAIDAALDEFLASREQLSLDPDLVYEFGAEQSPMLNDTYYGFMNVYESNESFQILLGNKEEFDALQEGKAKIEHLPFNNLYDLADQSLDNGKEMDMESFLQQEMLGGKRSNVASNPPIEAYVIRMNK